MTAIYGEGCGVDEEERSILPGDSTWDYFPFIITGGIKRMADVFFTSPTREHDKAKAQAEAFAKEMYLTHCSPAGSA